MCTLRELQDGTYNLEDVALMNEILDAKDFVIREQEKRNKAKR